MKRDYILPAMFLMLPFGILSLGIIHQSHHFALMVTGVVIMATLISNLWVRAFMYYCALWQTILFLFVMVNKFPVHELLPSVIFLLFLFSGGAVYLASCYSRIKNEAFYNIFCIAALLQTAIALMQNLFGFDPLLVVLNLFLNAKPFLDTHTVTGTMGNPNFVAGFLAISLPFFFRGKLKSFKPQWWWGVIPIALVLIVSRSSSAAVPAIIGAAYYFGGINYMAFGIIPVVCYLIYDDPFTQLRNFTAEGRGNIWSYVINQIFDTSFLNLIFGRGNAAPYGRNYPMHNEYLTVLFQYGLVGLSLLVGYILTIHRKNKVLFTAFIIAALNMFGSYPLHLAPSAFLIVMIAGLLERERGDDVKRER